MNLQQWDFFFFLAFIIGLYSIHRLAAVREVGEVDRKVVFHKLLSEVQRDMRNFSTVGGLRNMTQLPLLAVKHYKRRGK